MDARMRGTMRGEAGLWLARIAGLGLGLAAVLGAILLGWLTWPALFGGGIRMFEHLADEHISLEILDVLTTPSAIHTRFAVNRGGA